MERYYDRISIQLTIFYRSFQTSESSQNIFFINETTTKQTEPKIFVFYLSQYTIHLPNGPEVRNSCSLMSTLSCRLL